MPLTTYTAGEVLTAASLNDNFTFAAANPPATPGGLVFIKSETIGTAVSDVTITGAFSATYDNYKITFSGSAANSGVNTVTFQLGATTTGYYYTTTGLTFAGATSAFSDVNGASGPAGISTENNVNVNLEIMSPNLAKRTVFFGPFIADTTTGLGRSIFGFVDNATQYTSVKFITSPATITGGTIRVYGYANS
jgi:hypothetical protein